MNGDVFQGWDVKAVPLVFKLFIQFKFSKQKTTVKVLCIRIRPER